MGSQQWPWVGPTSRATKALPLAAPAGPISTEGGTTSSTVRPVRPSFSRLAPKVLAHRIWAPAST